MITPSKVWKKLQLDKSITSFYVDKNFYVDLKPGNVFTVEPGIYIRRENLGVRLEDNIVIGEKKNINLMKNIPILPKEIEDLMNQ